MCACVLLFTKCMIIEQLNSQHRKCIPSMREATDLCPMARFKKNYTGAQLYTVESPNTHPHWLLEEITNLPYSSLCKDIMRHASYVFGHFTGLRPVSYILAWRGLITRGNSIFNIRRCVFPYTSFVTFKPIKL